MINPSRPLVIALLLILSVMPGYAAFAGGQSGRTKELLAAITKQDAAKVKALLAAGADANSRDKEKTPALAIAAELGSLPICEALLQHGAKVNDSEEEGSSALAAAVSSNRVAVVKLLLSRGAGL